MIEEPNGLDLKPLFEEAEADLKFELEHADQFSLKLSSLREKWCRKAVFAELARKKAEIEAKAVWVERRDYYMTVHPLRVDRRDVDDYIEADEKYKPHMGKLELLTQKIKYISGIIEALDRAGYNVGNAIKWAVFKNGG